MVSYSRAVLIADGGTGDDLGQGAFGPPNGAGLEEKI